MERSRSKRNYFYDQDYDADARTKPRYNHSYVGPTANNHRRARQPKPQDSPVTVTTNYRILCHDMKAGGVIGKSGSIIKSIRQHTGAWINVHELVAGDEERIIEISDTRRRDTEGRMPSFSPAQEALFLIHERILESDAQFGGVGYGGNEEDELGGGRGGSDNRVATRLVVSRLHVGSLLGKGGKIIEQMRMETKTQIRVLPRDHMLPRCVSMSEEIVQVVGDVNSVKNAIEIISARLRESQHRDRGNFHGRQSPDQFFPPEDDYIPHIGSTARRPSMDLPQFGSRMQVTSFRNNNYAHRPSGFANEPGASPLEAGAQPFYGEDLVFRILCPVDKVNRVIGETDGIIDLLQNEVGVDVKIADPVAGTSEQIIIISSEEGPDDELFPAQEALLHIQTLIVDILPDKDNIITTRLLVASSEIECLEGRDGSLYEMKRLTGADIQILPREERPGCVSLTDELVQIVGEIKAARDALVEVTSRLRSYLYKDFFHNDAIQPITVPVPVGNVSKMVTSSSPTNIPPVLDGHAAIDHSPPAFRDIPLKEAGGSGGETVKREDAPTAVSRIPVPFVTRSTFEVVIPDYAVAKLITKSRNKLAQISELSGANVTLVEDRPDVTEKMIQISGTPEQSERAQSLLQGFILSMQEDGP